MIHESNDCLFYIENLNNLKDFLKMNKIIILLKNYHLKIKLI